jgi:UDP-N-acetylglucosamine:LPS N-acetylglucosamine transferase
MEHERGGMAEAEGEPVSEGPRVLVVTSSGAPPSVVTPVLAALDAHGLTVRALDVGRVGSRSSRAAWRVLRAIVGELAERRLLRELDQHPPDVAIAFDPTSAAALAAARDQADAPAPVVAVVPELEPDGEEWQAAGADRYLTVDDHAAVALADGGVDGARVLPVGPFCPLPYAQAGREARAALRARFKLAATETVVLVEVAGLGYETCSQLALQLSLIGQKASYLFAAGDDADAATALRRQVPTLGLRAKLFGHTTDAPLLWRCADVVVARPRASTVAKGMAVGARIVAFAPDDAGGKAMAEALEARRMGVAAQGALFVSSALEAVLATGAPPATHEGEDGAANAADVVWVVGKARREIIDEARASERAHTSARVQAAARAAASATRSTAAAGDLEDLGGGFDDGGAAPGGAAPEPEPPDPAEIERLRRDLDARMARAQRTVNDAQQSAARWQKKSEEGRALGSEATAREADRNADLERARMHTALAELAELSSEREALERAAREVPRRRAAPRPPPRTDARPDPGPSRPSSARTDRSVDDLLDDLKRTSGPSTGPTRTASSAKSPGTVDDELEALKRKMSGQAQKKRGKP